LTDLVQSEGAELPPVIALNRPEIAYDIWAIWMATGRRFLPSQIMDEPEDLLSDMITLDGVYQAMKDKYNGNKDD